MTGCRQCSSVQGSQQVEMSIGYPQEVKEGDYAKIHVDLIVGWLRDFSVSLCIYESGGMLTSEAIHFSTIFGQTISKDYTFKMSSRNLVFNFSIIKPGLFGDECDDFATFTIYHRPPTYSCVSNVCTIDPSSSDTYQMCISKGCGGGIPPTKKYTCPGIGKTCVEDSNSQYSYTECVAQGCTGAGGGCGTGKIDLFGSCYKTSDLAIAVGVVVLFMMMTKK